MSQKCPTCASPDRDKPYTTHFAGIPISECMDPWHKSEGVAGASQEAGRGVSERDWADIWAQDFHDTYERIAPKFGYETRPESAKPWSEVPEKNRKLMQSVVAEVLCRFLRSREVGE